MTYFKTKEQCLQDLTAFLSIASVSTEESFSKSVAECGNFVADKLKSIGFEEIRLYKECKHPIVYTEKIVDAHFPTLLIYGHYDVQPADPLHLWESNPFQPQIRNGKIYARGASDDKSQVHLIMVALDKLISSGNLKCNIKVVFEGEEEIGSPGLYSFVAKYKEMLAADTLLVCDTAMPELNQPALICGLRGIVYFDLEVNGFPHDLHSGMIGGGVMNPFNELSKLLGLLSQSSNELIPGELDNKSTLLVADETASIVPDELKKYATPNFYEQVCLKSSFDIHGFSGGYSGEGAKTIIPSSASVKCSFRLSMEHDEEEVITALHQFIKKNLQPTLNYDLRIHASCNAVEVATDSPEIKLAAKTLEKHFNNAALLHRIGGTIPVVSLFKQELNLTPLLMGFGLDEDKIHAPNESFSLYNYFKGVDVLVDFISAYGEELEIVSAHSSISTLSKSFP